MKPSPPTAPPRSAPPGAGALASRRPRGRPRRQDAPSVPWPAVDAELVFGQRVTDPATGVQTVRFPKMVELAQRYGVSRSRVWQFAQRERCLERREEVRLKTRARFEDKVIESTARERALAATEIVQVIDEFLGRFQQELRAGKVKTDSAADLDRLVRLRELMTGGADARTELQGGLSLAAIQDRHRVQRGLAERLTPQLTGTAGVEPPVGAAGGELDADAPDGEVHSTRETGR